MPARVRGAVEEGRFPLVLAGDCNSALGALSGIGPDGVGVIWFDAHGDYNTPETSLSGWFEGMPLAVATGRCHHDLWRGLGNTDHVREAHTLLVGVRDLDPPERDLLDGSDVTVIEADKLRGGKLAEGLAPALARLRERVGAIYLHLDMDAVDPADAPGVGLPTPGGLSRGEMLEAIRLIGEQFAIRAAALTTFNPDQDADNRTLETGLAMMEEVVKALST